MGGSINFPTDFLSFHRQTGSEYNIQKLSLEAIFTELATLYNFFFSFIFLQRTFNTLIAQRNY